MQSKNQLCKNETNLRGRWCSQQEEQPAAAALTAAAAGPSSGKSSTTLRQLEIAGLRTR